MSNNEKVMKIAHKDMFINFTDTENGYKVSEISVGNAARNDWIDPFLRTSKTALCPEEYCRQRNTSAAANKKSKKGIPNLPDSHFIFFIIRLRTILSILQTSAAA